MDLDRGQQSEVTFGQFTWSSDEISAKQIRLLRRHRSHVVEMAEQRRKSIHGGTGGQVALDRFALTGNQRRSFMPIRAEISVAPLRAVDERRNEPRLLANNFTHVRHLRHVRFATSTK